MIDWESSIGKITAIFVSIGGLLVAILFVWQKWEEICEKILKPFWQKIMKPFLKFTLVALTLVIPNGFIIGFLLYQVAFSYWKIQSLDFIITNEIVFIQLVGLQTILISLYSFLWTKLFFPRLRDWLCGRKNNVPKNVDDQQNTNITYSGGLS